MMFSLSSCTEFYPAELSTFAVLVQMGDVLSGVTANTLCADLLAHHCGAGDSRRAAVCLLHDGDDISVDLSKHKRGVVLERELALLDGLDWDGPAAVHS